MNPVLRASPRYPVSLRVAFPDSDGIDEATSLSVGGMFVRTDRELAVGALMPVALELPDGDPPAPVQAKILYTSDVPKARDLLRDNGWTQLYPRAANGSYCLSGALREAAGNDRNLYRAALRSVGTRLNVAGCEHGGFDCHCAVIGWNDAEGRTRQQVINKLDEAISAELAATGTATQH